MRLVHPNGVSDVTMMMMFHHGWRRKEDTQSVTDQTCRIPIKALVSTRALHTQCPEDPLSGLSGH